MNYILLVVIVTCNFTIIKAIHWLLATDTIDSPTEHYKDYELHRGFRSNEDDHILLLTKKPHDYKTEHKSLHLNPGYLSTLVNKEPEKLETYDQDLEEVSNEKRIEDNEQLIRNFSPYKEKEFLPSLQYEVPEYGISRKAKKIFNKIKANRTNQFRNNHQSKFLEVFEVVEFDHVVCTSSSGLEGTCLHEFDCQSIGGATMGSCADGLGTCCVIVFTCDSHTAAPIGWFNNPSFPSPSSERLSCSITLDKISDDIKQFRLDLTNFELLPPTSGTCEQDQFSVSGQDVNNVIPIICGINSGQHMYIEVGNTDGPINLSVQTLNEENRLFSIKVTQLTAADNLAAPTGCLQYYTEDHGHMESFNYRDRSEIGIPRSLGYLNNLNYAICIARSPSTCTITYTNVGEMQIVNYDTDGTPIIPPRQAGVEIYNCPSDWLLIAAVRLCGERLNDGAVLQDFSLDAPVTDDGAGPTVIWFRSDGVYAGRGFKLHYQQNSCSMPT